MTLTLDFQGKFFKKSYLRNGMTDWHGIKGMWVDRMLGPCCDFQCPPHLWPWPWIFQGQTLKMLYLRNGRADWHGTKGMWVDRMLNTLCDFQLWPKPWPWPWIFKVNFRKSHIRNGMADWHGMKGMWVDRMLDPCCDFQLSPYLWPWPWIFKVKFKKKSLILWMGWPIDLERKGCESIECWTHVVTFNVLFHDLDLGFSRSNLKKKSCLRNGMADWHGTKGMWVDRMLDSHCDFKLWPHPWPWP